MADSSAARVCFVIQPFNTRFNKRFEDVFLPAIKGANLNPYRVDRDPGTSIPIDTIESEIRKSELCFCDISEDNPNVWFELGFAIASGKQVCLVRERTSQKPLPFDVQHRHVIFYEVESLSDFEKLRDAVIARLKAMIVRVESELKLEAQAADDRRVAHLSGLGDRDATCMMLFGLNQDGPDGDLSFYEIARHMEKIGYNQLATHLSIRMLTKLGYINQCQKHDYNGDDYTGYSITEGGWNFLENNSSFDDQYFPQDVKALRSDLDEEVPF